MTREGRSTWRRGGAKLWTVLGIGAAGLACGAYALRPGAASYETNTADVGVAKKMSFDVTTTAAGELEARNRIEIRNPLENESAIVWIIAEGATVKAGEKLIQLNADAIKQKVDEESLRLESARADQVAAENSYNIQINENASKLSQAQLKVALAELALRQWREGEVAKKRQDLSLSVDKATLEVDRLAERFLRSQSLLDDGFVSKDECDRDEVAYIEAISAFNSAHLAADIYENYEYPKEEKTKISDLEQARSELERVALNNDIELTSKEASRTNKRSQVAILENKVAKLKADLAAATINAPKDGLVVYATTLDRAWWGGRDGGLQIGQQVYPNQLLMVLPDTSEMVATVRVHESLASKVQQGLPVSVKIEAAGGRVFPGTVQSIGVMAESGGWRDPNLREYSVKIALSEKAEGLKPAMRAEARIILDAVKDSIAVPVSAVFQDGPVQYVYVPHGAKYVKQPVRLGRRSDTQAELLAGIAESQSVLLREPTPGEILARPWDEGQLKLAGYSRNDSGDIVAAGGPGKDGPGRRADRRGHPDSATPAATGPEAPAAETAAVPANPAPEPEEKAPSTPATTSGTSGAVPAETTQSPGTTQTAPGT